MFTLIVKIVDVGDRRRPSGTVESRNASDSSDHVVKMANRLGCLGWCVHTGHKNSRRRKILTILRISGNHGLIIRSTAQGGTL